MHNGCLRRFKDIYDVLWRASLVNRKAIAPEKIYEATYTIARLATDL